MAKRDGATGPEQPTTDRRGTTATETSARLVQESLQGVVDLAPLTVPGADHAGVTVIGRDGDLRSAASTDDVVVQLDRIQEEHGEGPCLDASRDPEEVLVIQDMASETRWSHFTEQARDLGVNSMIAWGLDADGEHRAALNIHAAEPDAFDPFAMEVAELLAGQAASALDHAALIESLKVALISRQRIGEATGILMERKRIGSAAAFKELVTASQQLNVKLRDLAEHVVRTGQDPAAAVVRRPRK